MTRHRPTLLRLPIQIAIWTLLLVALLGPHQQWSVCMTGDCYRPTSEKIATGCCCCCPDAADAGRGEGDGDGDGDNGAERCGGCCVDFAMAIDEAPLPKPVQAPDHSDDVVATLPPTIVVPSGATAASYQARGADPPRVDRRIDLIATTVLRE